ncbi:MAG TPA: hypothetical protein VGN00_14175 [Puia sp.]|jgi:hypothetical protein
MNPATPRRALLIIGATIAAIVILAACHHFFYDCPAFNPIIEHSEIKEDSV